VQKFKMEDALHRSSHYLAYFLDTLSKPISRTRIKIVNKYNLIMFFLPIELNSIYILYCIAKRRDSEFMVLSILFYLPIFERGRTKNPLGREYGYVPPYRLLCRLETRGNLFRKKLRRMLCPTFFQPRVGERSGAES
jgi:hypothetical protein